MTASIHSVPDELFIMEILPRLKVKNPLRLNDKILEEARNFRAFGLQCRRFQVFVQDHLAALKAEYEANQIAGALVKAAVGKGIIRNPLQVCVMNGKEADFLALLRIGLNVNAQDRCGRSVLHTAAQLAKRHFVEVILTHPETRTDLVTRTGLTPAEFTKSEEVRQLILAKA